MLALTISFFAFTVFALAPPNPLSSHQVQLPPNSSLYGAFDTTEGFGFATADSDHNLSVYNSDGNLATKKPLSTATQIKTFFGLKKETFTLRAPVKGYGQSVAYMLQDNKTLVDREVAGEKAYQYTLEGASEQAFDVDKDHIAYVKDKEIVILDKKSKKTIASIPVEVNEAGKPIEIRNLEFEGKKLAITQRGGYQLVNFTNAAAPKIEINVSVPLIGAQLVTTNKGECSFKGNAIVSRECIYHAILNGDGECKAYTGGIRQWDNAVTGVKTYTFKDKAHYEVNVGKESLVAINAQLSVPELMTVTVKGNQAVVQRFEFKPKL